MFDFDEATHYFIDADSAEFKLLVTMEQSPKTEEDKMLVTLFHDNYPNDLNDEKFWNFLKTSKKIHGKIINESLYPQLRKDVFVNTGVERTEEYACISEYRDIFVFRKNGEATGIAKICFHCKQYVFIPDSWSNTFGASGEFDKLKTILKLDNGQ